MNKFFSTNNTIPTFFQFADLFGFVFCFFFNPLIFCTHTNEKIRFCIDAENVCGCNKKTKYARYRRNWPLLIEFVVKLKIDLIGVRSFGATILFDDVWHEWFCSVRHTNWRRWHKTRDILRYHVRSKCKLMSSIVPIIHPFGIIMFMDQFMWRKICQLVAKLFQSKPGDLYKTHSFRLKLFFFFGISTFFRTTFHPFFPWFVSFHLLISIHFVVVVEILILLHFQCRIWSRLYFNSHLKRLNLFSQQSTWLNASMFFKLIFTPNCI